MSESGRIAGGFIQVYNMYTDIMRICSQVETEELCGILEAGKEERRLKENQVL